MWNGRLKITVLPLIWTLIYNTELTVMEILQLWDTRFQIDNLKGGFECSHLVGSTTSLPNAFSFWKDNDGYYWLTDSIPIWITTSSKHLDSMGARFPLMTDVFVSFRRVLFWAFTRFDASLLWDFAKLSKTVHLVGLLTRH